MHRAAIEEAFPEAMVHGHGTLVPSLTLPDPDDRHVLAVAIASGSAAIVTQNARDFPAPTLARFGIQPSSTDDFLADAIDLDRRLAVTALRAMRQRFRRPELTPEEFLRRLESQGLTQTANLLIAENDGP